MKKEAANRLLGQGLKALAGLKRGAVSVKGKGYKTKTER
jgi:hypothetical protein